MAEEINKDSLQIMSANYMADLDVLRGMNPVIVTSTDVAKLRKFCLAYGIKDEIEQTKKSYYDTMGKLMDSIRNKLETYTIEKLLEKVKETDVRSTPPEHATDSVSELPKSFGKKKTEG